MPSVSTPLKFLDSFTDFYEMILRPFLVYEIWYGVIPLGAHSNSKTFTSLH